MSFTRSNIVGLYYIQLVSVINMNNDCATVAERLSQIPAKDYNREFKSHPLLLLVSSIG